MNSMRKNYGLGVNITPDLVNNFFSLNPKGQTPLKYVKHTATSGCMTGATSGAMTPGNAFNINDVNYFEEQLTLGNMGDSDEELEQPEDINEFLLPEPIDSEEYKPAVQEMSTEIYDNYSFDHKYDEGLTITSERERVLQTIEANRVTIIEGDTGSGKTTQVPQYILDHYRQRRKFCNILVTQPRKIAAITVANRVADERNWPRGTLVGYQVARDRNVTEDTRITYLTTGVLLQKLIKNKHLNDYTHIILDEVHERDQEIDFSMLVVRYYLKTVSKHVKVVLMSATADCSLFSNYFSILVNNRKEGAPVLSVGGKMHEVHEYYFEDLTGLSDPPQQTIYEASITEKCYRLCREIIMRLDHDESDGQFQPGSFADTRGTVLCFLPGVPEIKCMQGYLNDLEISCKLKIMPLHSKISNNEQGHVFIPPRKGERKVILSTNIAESSITVADIKYVIDFCLTKETETDRDTRFQRLILKWASRASLKQRRGRAGRVSDGHVFRLISRRFYEEFDDYAIPEMLRAPLEQVILQVKLLDLGPSPSMTLQLALQPPRVGDIKSTILMLKEVGAITIHQNSKINPLDGDITFVGRVLGSLPVDVHIGKFLLIGYSFGVLEECLVIAACLSLKSIFTIPFNSELKAYAKKMHWAKETFCDMLTSLNAFLQWKFLKSHKGFGMPEKQWAREWFLEWKRFREVDELVEDLRRRLLNFNIHTHRNIYNRENIDADDGLIIKLVIAGSFYPNYFKSQEIDEAEAAKSMNGHNPSTTVAIHGCPVTLRHYTTKVSHLFRSCGKGDKLHFENSRLFVEFLRDARFDCSIEPAVLFALKMRQVNMPLRLLVSKKKDEAFRLSDCNKPSDVYNPETGLRTGRVNAKLNSNNRDNVVEFSVTCDSKQVKLKDSGYFDIIVQVIVSPSHFWATYGDKETLNLMYELNKKINIMDGKNLQVLDEDKILVGILCLTLFENEYYRAEIKSISSEIEVFFVDFGNTEMISDPRMIRRCPSALMNYPYQAFECFLSEIYPAEGTWSEQAKDFFEEHVPVASEKLIAKIYSQIHNTYRLDLFVGDTNVNRLLIKKGFAIYKEEPLISKNRHEEMLNVPQASSEPTIDQSVSTYCEDVLEEPDPRNEEVMKINLRGPFSSYEMTFGSMTRVGRTKSTRIERDSVNSVLVSDQQEVKSQRFLVAAAVTMNPTGSTMNARETCLLPNIRGLQSILALVFTPQAELRCDKDATHYTGALCGLGANNKETGDGILNSNDIEIAFDVKLETRDIMIINSIRLTMNKAIGFSHEKVDHAPEQVARIQNIAREKLLDLIHTRRQEKEPEQYRHEYQWNDVDELLLLNGTYENAPSHLFIYLKGIFFCEQSQVDPRIEEKRNKLKAFHELAGSSVEYFKTEVVCPICDVVCRHPRGLYLHCETRHHRDWNEAIFRDTEQ